MKRRSSLSSASAIAIVGLLVAVVAAASASAQAELAPAPAGTFTIAVLPDTQHYRGRATKAEPESEAPVSNAVFDAYTSWIAGNLETQRIAFVSHVGDVVDLDVPDQWIVARKAMSRIHGRVPYGISVGNHDMDGSGESRLFQTTFPAARYTDMSWYGGSYPQEDGDFKSGNNANSYQLFSADGHALVFVHLECNAPDEVLEWMDEILGRHADRIAFVTTHMSLGPLHKPKERQGYVTDPKGLMQWTKCHGDRGNSPQQMWDKSLSKHPNLRAVFSGDQSRTQSMYIALQGDAGNVVHHFMSDYGTDGLRLYRFTPNAGRLDVITYNPVTAALTETTRLVPDRGRHQFSVHLPLR